MSTKKTNSIIALGTFDGVHLGHQFVLQQVLDIAQDQRLNPIIVTFFPHPSHVLTPDKPLKLINSIDERVKRIQSYGIEKVYVQEFTKEFSMLSAEDFIVNTLIKKLNLSTLILGYDHSFGKDKSGDFEQLKALGEKYNFKVKKLAPYYHEGTLINSSYIRQAIAQGQIEKVNQLLGYDFCLYGKVIQGNQLGRKIGFNTANIALNYSNQILPKVGVYVVKSKIDGQEFFGMMNIGFRPTVDGKTKTIEVNYFDLDQDLYFQKIKVKVLSRLRDEMHFKDLIELKSQLEKDKEEAINRIKSI